MIQYLNKMSRNADVSHSETLPRVFKLPCASSGSLLKRPQTDGQRTQRHNKKTLWSTSLKAHSCLEIAEMGARPNWLLSVVYLMANGETSRHLPPQQETSIKCLTRGPVLPGVRTHTHVIGVFSGRPKQINISVLTAWTRLQTFGQQIHETDTVAREGTLLPPPNYKLWLFKTV